MKHCNTCQTIKPLEDFNKCSASKDGRQYKCRVCEKTYLEKNLDKKRARSKKYREENKAQLKERNDLWRANNKEKTAEMNRDWRKRRPEVEKAQKKRYYEENKEEIRNYQKQWRKENADKMRGWNREYAREQRRTNPQYVVRHRLSNRIRGLMTGEFKSESTEALIGCTYIKLCQHIESQFTTDMSWNLLLEGKIHIDHIRPCCSFDLTQPEERAICFHYTNLRPMWEIENKRKLTQDLKMRKSKNLEKNPESSVSTNNDS